MAGQTKQHGVIPDAARIDVLRITAGLTWGELVDRAELSLKVRTKLRGGQRVSVKSLRRIAGALGVEFVEIVDLPKSVRGEASCERAAVAVGA